LIFRLIVLLSLFMISSDAHARTDSTEATRAFAEKFLRRLFVENDVDGAYTAYATPDFIQHNPLMADGIAGRRAYFAALAKEPQGRPSGWAHVFNMVLVDGDLFAVHHHVFRSPEDRGRVFVDIWRVAGGRIVEHWDVIQAIPETMAHSNGMACGRGQDFHSAKALGDTLANPACGLPDPRADRDASMRALQDYVTEVGAGHVRAAVQRWFSGDYRQHSPTIAEGAEGAIAYLEREFGKGPSAMPRAGPARVVAEGDYVLFHRLVTYAGSDRPSSNIDIFRVTSGKISEHWDVKQPVPDTSANKNGMW
jgi:predicted SnoaL-like aldol condensation-catalyzing enzyme